MDLSPLLLSVRAATLATIITFVLGIYSAYFTLRLNKLKGFVDGLFTLPLVLPPTVVGFLLLVTLGKNSIIGRFLLNFDITIVFTELATIIASAVVSFPLMYRTVRGSFEQIDKNLIYVGRTLGLSEHEIFRKIMLPNSFNSIMAGTVLAFARALGEFGATIMIAGNIPGKTQTMAVAVYSAVQAGDRALAYKWVLIIVTISFATMMLLNVFENKNTKKYGKGSF